jgi:hypothetical protein
MSDLTLPIIVFTSFIGYLFNKNGRKRVNDKSIDKFEKTNGSNIYTSDMVNEANQEILDRSLENYKRAQNPEQTGFLPPLFNAYSVVGNEAIMTPELNKDLSNISKQQIEVSNLNKIVDVTNTGSGIPIEKRPMFNAKGTERVEDNYSNFGMNVGKETSLLTGLPIDNQHNNMVPFFGSNVKQNVEKFDNVSSVLDLHTGKTSTFKHKNEVGKFFQDVAQDINGTPIFTEELGVDRFVSGLYRQNEKPFQDEKVYAQIAGTANNNIRPTFKDVNDLRPLSKPKESFRGDIIAGQRGSVRGAQSEAFKNRPDTYYESTQDHLFRTTGEFVAPAQQENFITNFKPTSRKDYNINHYGPAISENTAQRQQLRLEARDGLDGSVETSLVQQPKRQNFDNDFTRNVGGITQVHDYGKNGITNYETERTTTSYDTVLNAQQSNIGHRVGLQDNLRSTLKETVLNFDNSGNVKTTYDLGKTYARDLGIININAKATNKETTVDNDYTGNIHKRDNMGYLVNKYEARTTGKETITNNSSYMGTINNASKNTMSRDNFTNAEISEHHERLLTGERPSGPQNFQIQSGKDSFGDIKYTNNMELKESNDNRAYHANFSQIVPSTMSMGIASKVRHDDDVEDTVFNDRFNVDIVNKQLHGNPYALKH